MKDKSEGWNSRSSDSTPCPSHGLPAWLPALIGHNLDAQISPPWPIEFAEKNALPASQDQAPVFDQQDLRAADDGGLQVRVAVAVVVMVFLPAGSQALQELIQVPLQGRVVVFVDQNGRRGVRKENLAGPVLHSR